MSPPSATVRSAVIGAGLMGRWHADAIRRVGGQVALVMDADIGRAESLASGCGAGARATVKLEDVLLDGSLDVVHVCTPLQTHASIARLALSAGLHVLCEKPLAETAPVTAELLALARARGRLLCPTHQFLFQEGMRQVCGCISEIAPILHVELQACSAGADGYFTGGPDGLIAEIVPHPLAILARLFPGELSRAGWQVLHPSEGELRASASMGGASVTLLVSAHGRPTVNQLRIIGGRGTLEADLFHGFAVRRGGAVSRLHKIAGPFTHSGQTLLAAGENLARRATRGEVAYPGLRRLTRQFYTAVRAAAAPPLGEAEILEVACARDALVARLVER